MRYFVGFLLTICLIIIVIIMLLQGGGKPKTPVVTSKTLDSYASTSAEVRLTTDGPVNADSRHDQVRITVSRDNVSLEHLRGYDDGTLSLQRYDNSQSAYETFLLALARAGFTKGNTDKALRDERGYCPQGNRYIVELTQNDRTLERFWGTSCGKPKTYLGNLGLTIDLFQAQVPDYDTQSSGIDL